MSRYTIEQRIEIVKIHYRNGENFAETVRKVQSAFGRYEAPSRSAVVDLIKKFERSGSVADVKRGNIARPTRSIENISAVAESVAESPVVSIRRRAQQLGTSYGTLHRILHKDLGLLLGGNQRDLARAKNQKKQQELMKKKTGGKDDKGMTLEQRKFRDAELMREKQKKKEEEEEAARASSTKS